MQVTNVRVSFLREKQPAQYEKATPSVEFSAVLDAGDDHRLAARSLMIDATAIVYAGIGYAVPAKVAAALLDGETPDKLDVTVGTEDTPPQAPLTTEQATVDGSDVPGDEVAEATPKKTRGRPKGSKNTRPKAGTKAAEKAAPAEDAKGGLVKTAKKAATPATKAADVPDDDIPGDTPRVGPEDDPKDHGVEAAPAATGEFTAKDLHTMIIDLIYEKKLSLPSARQLLAHFQVARAKDLTPEQAVEGKGMIEKMIAAS